MDTSVKDAIQLYQAQVELTDKIWWYFASVSLGVLGFTIGSGKAQESWLGLLALLMGYVIFFLGSGYSLRNSQKDLVALGKVVSENATRHNSNSILGRFKPLSTNMVSVFHATIAAVVIAVLVCLIATTK